MLAAIQWAHVSTKNGRMNERALANRSDGAHRLAVSLFIAIWLLATPLHSRRRRLGLAQLP